jgi:malonyl-ACP decarboxylase
LTSGSVVVSGLGVATSLATDVEAFCATLVRGTVGIGRRPHNGRDPRLAPTLSADVEAAAVVSALRHRHGEQAVREAGRTAALTSLAALLVARDAWHDAQLDREPLPPHRVGIVLAGSNHTAGVVEEVQADLARSPAYVSPTAALRIWDTHPLALVSQSLGIQGESAQVGAASASGTVAIHVATRALRDGTLDACLVVGALQELSDAQRQAMFNTGAMAPDDPSAEPWTRCRPFDADRCGFVPGHGSAAVLLETADSAASRGVRARARVLGSSVRLAGSAGAEPHTSTQVEVLHEALGRSGIEPDLVDYVSAHATGSLRGDDCELEALEAVFGRPYVNATKALIGHCLGAAGVVAAVATVLQLEHGVVHPVPQLRRPPDTPLRLVGPAPVRTPLQHAITNGFGFGGFNASVVLAR